jgi:transcriptional regulator with XRE-family HTH domain
MTSANSLSLVEKTDPTGPAREEETFLGARLRGLRQQHGLSLRGLAAQVGVTATALHSWECGRRNPKHKHLQAFADAFKVPKAELLAGVDGELGEMYAALGNRRRDGAGLQPGQRAQLAEVVAACKERIAAVAGISAERVRIVLEI